VLNVAVGIIKNQFGEILISQRSKQAYQGGLWEFPGGKLESGESSYQALKRELFEELGITILSAKPFLEITHQYADLSVFLDIFVVDAFHGEPKGMEMQAIKWVAISDLKQYQFPAANKKIVDTLRLPNCYPIVDESHGDEAAMLQHLNRLICKGYTMIQLRAKSFQKVQFNDLAKQAIKICEENNVTLFLNTNLANALALKASVVHLSWNTFNDLSGSMPAEMAFGVSCHSREQLEKAHQAGALFAVLSPVKQTLTHIDSKALGWAGFGKLVESLPMPVYALGGVGPEDLEQAVEEGAHGVSGIRAF